MGELRPASGSRARAHPGNQARDSRRRETCACGRRRGRALRANQGPAAGETGSGTDGTKRVRKEAPMPKTASRGNRRTTAPASPHPSSRPERSACPGLPSRKRGAPIRGRAGTSCSVAPATRGPGSPCGRPGRRWAPAREERYARMDHGTCITRMKNMTSHDTSAGSAAWGNRRTYRGARPGRGPYARIERTT